MRYLIDADTISFLVRRHRHVSARFKALKPAMIGISTITMTEIEYGLALTPTRREQIEAVLDPLLARINLLTFSAEDARAAASAKAALKTLGKPIGPYDIQLAGTALARGLVLVSHNTRKYGRVGGLRVEDWTAQ